MFLIRCQKRKKYSSGIFYSIENSRNYISCESSIKPLVFINNGPLVFYRSKKIIMETFPTSNYLSSVQKQFQYYKQLGDKTFEQLPDEALFHQTNPESNSIAIIVKHLWGNMKSRWTDFLTTDGEKPWRDREGEFMANIKNRKELIEKWEEGWKTVFEALATINEENFDKTIYIRNMGHSIIEAVNRQLCHYAYHVGQMVYIGRMHMGSEWESLSIPKGASKEYNQKKFAQPKRNAHFTEDFIDENEAPTN